MRKIIAILLSSIITLPIFSVEYRVVGKHGNLYDVFIAPQDKTLKNMKLLAIQLEKAYGKEMNADVFVFDDENVAKTANEVRDANLDNNHPKSLAYDKHFVGMYWKTPSARHDFTIMLDGLNGETQTINYKTTDLKKLEKELLPDSENTYTPTAADETIGKIATVFPFVFLFGIIVILANWKRWRHKVWFEFFVAFFLGGFGVQKFREKKYGLGVLYILTGGCWLIGWLVDCIRYFVAAVRNKPILPVATKKEIENALLDTQKKMIEIIQSTGQLPVDENAPIILNPSEICHYSQEAYYLETKNVVLGRKSTGGARSTTFLGVRYSVGGAQSQTIRGDVTTQTAGILTITSDRIIFTARKGAFNKKITELTSLVPERTTIGFQFGEKYYVLQSNTVDLIVTIIKALLNHSEE